MSSNLNKKNRLYEFEKFAIIIVLVLAIAITLLVVFATSGDDGDEGSAGKKQPIIDVTESKADVNEENSTEEDKTQSESGVVGTESFPSATAEVIEFEPLTLSNNVALNNGEPFANNDLLLVNQDHEYRENIDEFLHNVYSEKVKVDCGFVLSTTAYELRKEAFDALVAMVEGFSADTNTPESTLIMSKAYVSVEDQQSGYDDKAQDADRSELPYMQAGGQSELQTGLAFHLDVYGGGNGKMGEGKYQWFYDNCWKYGFVLRYPEGEEDRTQFKAERHHFRYVGVPHAAYMYVNQWVLEDYLDYLIDKTNNNNRAKIKDNNGTGYEMYAVKIADGDTTEILVPTASSGWGYNVCNANNGYFVVTIFKSSND